MSETNSDRAPRSTDPSSDGGGNRRRPLVLGALLVITALAAVIVTVVLVTMFEHKQDARTPYLRVVDVDETSVDPRIWAQNWPHQFDQYLRTAGEKFYGGSSAMTQSKLEESPWLKRLFAGYAFSIDYRKARGHAYMLYDQMVTERVHKAQQAGACLHCHVSATVLYRKKGLEAMGRPATDEDLAEDFQMDAVIRGFQELSREPYHEVLAELAKMPDGTPDEEGAAAAEGDPVEGFDPEAVDGDYMHVGGAHPVACIDCHSPDTMAIRVTRPGFMQGISDLAAGDAEASHLPSIERWRQGDRAKPYDPNKDASRQEMRSFVCGQCHVEYYCASGMTLTFPWGNGLKMEDEERYWNELSFPDGKPFYDFVHGETGAKVLKAQHPEFEMWSQGIHARSGVSCADCHMPYERKGAMKLSNHNVRSPLENINNACQTCHNVPEDELRDRVRSIQDKTIQLKQRAAAAMTDMLDAIRQAQAAGADEDALAPIFSLQRKAMWRLDYIVSENSMGFHAPQETARILAESIDFSRQAEAQAVRLRAPAPPDTTDLPREPVRGVTGEEGDDSAVPEESGDAPEPGAEEAPEPAAEPESDEAPEAGAAEPESDEAPEEGAPEPAGP